MLNLKTELCSLLNIDVPIIQAGMAGGATTPELIANVSNAGGLGTIGAAYMSPEDIRTAIEKIRDLTDRPFAVNLFCVENAEELDEIHAQKVKEELLRIGKDLEIIEDDIKFEASDYFEAQFQVLIDEKVPVISTAFGLLSSEKMKIAKDKNIKVISMVTTVEEAVLSEKSGVVAVVAQGSDAGGHRSTFNLTAHPGGANVGTFSLVPQIADYVNIPVIAAGGVTDGRSLVAALALGADGVQLGTKFLATVEAGIRTEYKKRLYESTEEDTVLTSSFSGRPARGIRNKFIDEFGVDPLPYPYQNSATKNLRAVAAKNNNSEFMSLWAGQNLRGLVAEEYAGNIVREIIEEAEKILG